MRKETFSSGRLPCYQWGFTIPKRLRIYFMLDRKLLGKLSKCAWEVLSNYLKLSMPKGGSAPGAVVVVHAFGDFLNFNPMSFCNSKSLYIFE